MFVLSIKGRERNNHKLKERREEEFVKLVGFFPLSSVKLALVVVVLSDLLLDILKRRRRCA